MSVPNKTRTVVLTCSVAAITVTGTYYGAGLKTRQENKRVGLLAMIEHFNGTSTEFGTVLIRDGH